MKFDELSQKYRLEHIGPKTLDLRLIKKLLKYFASYKKWILIAVAFLIIAKVIEAAVPIYIGQMTQQIIDGSKSTLDDKYTLASIILYSSLLLIGLLIFGYILDTLSMVIKNWIGQKALYKLRTEVFNHIQHLPVEYYNKNPVGRLMTRTIHDIDQISQMFTESVIPIFGSLLLFFLMGIGIALLDWRIAIVFAFILPLVVWLTNRFRVYQRRAYDLVRNVVAAMNIFVQEHLMGASTIRNFGLQEQANVKFEEINEDHRIANLETIHHFSYFIAGIDFLQSLSLIFAFVILVLFAPPGTGFQAGIFFTLTLYVVMFFRPLADLAERYNILQSAMAAAERVFYILDQPIEPKEKLHEPELNIVNNIVFENVWFAYEGENWVLKGVSFRIEKGESIAIVGMTGAGKSSIINLLLRFYDFQKGSITINGKDIRDYPLHALRKAFSVVLQDPEIFSGTIYDNIALYDPEITPARINSIIDYVHLRSLISKFQDGLQHRITERGLNLSVGEMQLISLARAVAHDRSALILDEATANIDSHTEQMIQDTLKRVLHERTAIVIAHRLSTIKDVTRIIVIHSGTLVESGTHQELLKHKGIYEKLYRIQFLAKSTSSS